VVLLGVVALALWIARSRAPSSPSPSSSVATIRTAVVEQRDFSNTLRLSGTVEAVESIAITAPRIAGSQINQLTITKLIGSGSPVHKGDLLVEFDRQPQIKTFIDKQAEYQDLVDQIARKQSDEAAARAKDESDLTLAEDQLDKAKLEMQKNEILSRTDAEKNQEALTEAESNLKALRATFDLKRKTAASAIHDLEIQRDRAREIMQHAQDNENRMSIHSPIDGAVVMGSVWRGGSRGEVQEGDQVGPWDTIMQVVDPSAMQVRIGVNQEDVLALNPDQKAVVHLDAYPDLNFSAHLQELAPMGQNSEMSDKVRTFTALYRLEGSDPRLVPDLSAAVDVETEHVAQALVVPRDSVASEGAQHYVWVKTRTGFDKRPVEVGAESDLEAVVRSGLQARDVVQRGRS
jgi:HlyD family secretion protein